MANCERVGCARRQSFHVTVATVPQEIRLPGGETTMEGPNAGRSMYVCTQHLAGTVRTLAALPIIRYNARPAVSPMGV